VFPWVSDRAPAERLRNQKRFEQVYASRPFGVTLRPDGQRGIVSLFQTGNFGVWDLEAQKKFKDENPAIFNGLDVNMFQGLAAVTPSIAFTSQLWPTKEEDERLMYPTDVVYAQNGRFAVGIHTGTGTAGALTILDDAAITNDLKNAGTPVGLVDRQYFSVNPLCRSDANLPDCLGSDNVFSTIFETGGIPFARPRGVAIDPFVTIESPRYGEHVSYGTGIQVRWKDTGSAASTKAANFTATIFELSPGTAPTQVGTPFTGGVTALEKEHRTFKREVLRLFNLNAALPQDGKRYRIQIELTGTSGPISKTSVDVTFVK